MPDNKLNDAPVLDQLDGYWQKIAAMILWKAIGPGSTLTLTAADFAQMEGNPLVLFTHGHADSLDFRLVTPQEARRIAEHDRTQRGHA